MGYTLTSHLPWGLGRERQQNDHLARNKQATYLGFHNIMSHEKMVQKGFISQGIQVFPCTPDVVVHRHPSRTVSF